MQVKFLQMVDGDNNNNKFYYLKPNPDGVTFNAYYGRELPRFREAGYTNAPYTTKPASAFKSLYDSKVRKGYIDITEYKLAELQSSTSGTVQSSVSSASKITADNLLSVLKSYAETVVRKNYSLPVNSVTKAQMDKATDLLDTLNILYAKALSIQADKTKLSAVLQDFNKQLTLLFTILPRTMGKVADFLAHTERDLLPIIDRERNLLDALQSVVTTSAVANVTNNTEQKLRDSLGITVKEASDKEKEQIKTWLGYLSPKFVNAYVVRNEKSQKAYQNYLRKKGGKAKANVQCYWHGSRNENYLSILSKSLLLNPDPSVHRAGNMFGHGLYFADSADKSRGYTSCQGSYWSGGSDSRYFLMLFDVSLGRQVNAVSSDSQKYYRYTLKDINADGYDSIFAHATPNGLRRNEYIIFSQDACTPHFLIEMRS